MAEEKSCECKHSCMPKHHPIHRGQVGGGIYCFAMIGAAVYFIERADTFWMGVLGILKAIIWPALVIYKVLNILGL